MQPLKVPVRLGKAHYGEIGAATDVVCVVVELLLALRIERWRVSEQEPVEAEL